MKTKDLTKDNIRLDALAPRLMWGGAAVGVAAMLLGVVLAMAMEDGIRRFLFSYLTAFLYFLSFSLGALCFVMIQHLTRAGWSVVVRRISEAVAANVAPLMVLSLPIILGVGYLFRWTDAAFLESHPLVQGKTPYLNTGFFIVRWLIYFAVWIVLSQYLLRLSLRQDKSGDKSLTLRMEAVSAPGMLLFALTMTFASFDWIMSLDPDWYSTIMGVYYFSGAIVGFMALLALMMYLLQHNGRLQYAITAEHYHDVGKLLFGFTVFWAYIAYSQYMLYWYANIPEETAWYLRREVGLEYGPWTYLSLLLLFGHFIIPFFALLSRTPKRRKGLLMIAAVWLLAMHYCDLYWLVMPELYYKGGLERLPLSLLDLTCLLGIGGLYVASTAYWLRDQRLVPVKDPRLPESLAFENA